MLPILDAVESKAVDDLIINQMKLSSGLILMENAARSIAEAIKSYDNIQSVLILCGGGNNGGDGFALARHLYGKYDVKILFLGDYGKLSHESRINYDFATNCGIEIFDIKKDQALDFVTFDTDCIVDALIGVGGDENLRGQVIELLEIANRSNAIKIAIDVPTGMNANNGKAHPNCFQANATVTMFALKRGFLDKSKYSLVGDIFIAEMGVPTESWQHKSKDFLLESSDFESVLKPRKPQSRKQDFGRIAIIAGSALYPGAAAISANASVAAGGGLVHLFSTDFHQSLKPEVITHQMIANEDGGISSSNFDKIIELIKDFDAILIGPGLGNSENSLLLVEKIIHAIGERLPIVLDADALRILSKDSQLNPNVVLTPHHGEFCRMFDINLDDIQDNRADLVSRYAKQLNCNILLKGSTTIVATPDGKRYFSMTGNPGLASGGTGDALAGIVTSLVARSQSVSLSAAYSAFLHGLAADLYVNENAMESLTATDVINYLGKAIANVRSNV